MFKKILIALVVIIAVLVVVVALQPSEFRVERSTIIAAPPSEVFAQVNDFHKWDAWSPWVKLDPNAKNSFEGKPSGEGAIFKWDGNQEVGKGSMKLTESHPNDLIRIKLDFEEPMKATNDVEFTFKPEGNETRVTWSMSGRNNFLKKAFCLVMNMEKMVGGKYEEGLANLKSVVEAKKGAGN